jgi:hypothetical protein
LLKQISSLLDGGSWQPKSTLNVLDKVVHNAFFFYDSQIADYEKFPQAAKILPVVFVIAMCVFAWKCARSELVRLLILVVLIPAPICYAMNMLVDRYLLPSIIAVFILAGILLMTKTHRALQFLPILALLIVLPLGYPRLMTVGTNSTTPILHQALKELQSDEVILAEDFVVYMDLAAHQGDEPTVFIDENAHDEGWSSLEMIRDYNGAFKVHNKEQFLREHQKVMVVDAEKIQHFSDGVLVD